MTNKRKLSDLALDSGNANKGTERGRQAIEASIREFGFADAGTLDKHNTIIGGNKRTLAAGVIGMNEAIIIDVDGTQPVYIRRNDLDLSSTEDDRARRLAYALNRSQQLSLDWDTEQLMADLNAGFDLSALWRQDELDELLADLQPKGTEGDTEPQVDRAEELRQKWQVETGQMWQLGEHRLICGDCTDAAVVARVMGGEKAGACVTDPPYGISADKTMHEKGGQQYGNAAAPKRYYAESDWDSEAPNKQVIDYILTLAPQQIIWGGNYFELPPARCYLVWDKQNDGNQFADCELAWTNLDKPVRLIRHMWNGMIREGKEDRNSHPTQKPLGVIVWAIQQLQNEPSVVYDPFSGSGTTLIACENLGRRCRAVEISPGYVAVALERFHQHSGKLPVLITGE